MTSYGDGGTLPAPKAAGVMRYITIPVTEAALGSLTGQWSQPVHVRLQQEPNGTYELLFRNVELKHPVFACKDPNADEVQEAPPQAPGW